MTFMTPLLKVLAWIHFTVWLLAHLKWSISQANWSIIIANTPILCEIFNQKAPVLYAGTIVFTHGH